MRRFVFITLLCFCICAAEAKKLEAPSRTSFSNVSLGVQAGISGYGISAATPLCSFLYARLGFSYQSISFGSFNQEVSLPTSVFVPGLTPKVALKPKFKFPTGQLLFDFVPFRHGESVFFLTAGLFFGGNTLADVSGMLDQESVDKLRQHGITPDQVSVKIGDSPVTFSDDWSVAASAHVWKVRPYVGFGFGRPIPVRRVGFRFEMGAAFHGKPEIVSPNLTWSDDNEKLSNANKIISKIRVLPQIQFTLTVRLLKDN
ncbi:MAG: hypothetical protein KBS95_01485 [Alistipes sp.]|nr:hypothetical protein [Candidatus Alistipes equi]